MAETCYTEQIPKDPRADYITIQASSGTAECTVHRQDNSVSVLCTSGKRRAYAKELPADLKIDDSAFFDEDALILRTHGIDVWLNYTLHARPPTPGENLAPWVLMHPPDVIDLGPYAVDCIKARKAPDAVQTSSDLKQWDDVDCAIGAAPDGSRVVYIQRHKRFLRLLGVRARPDTITFVGSNRDQ